MPVTTPEAFNVNRWNDVTTSEVYAKDMSLVYTYTADGTKTYDQVLDIIKANIDISKPLKLVYYVLEDNDNIIFQPDSNGNNCKVFNVNCSKSGSIYVTVIGLYSDANVYRNISLSTDGTVGSNSRLPNRIANGDKFYCYQ